MLGGLHALSSFSSPLLVLVFVCSATSTPAAVPKLSNAQISEHYSTCIKLSTENVSVGLNGAVRLVGV